jgi:beta-ketoacyl-acyl-carrier-protein synthase II
MDGKVVITGMGTINPVGHNVNETWENIINGVSGVGPVTLFDAEQFNVRIACEIKDFQPGETLSAREIRRRDRFEQFAAVAAKEAIHQAGIEFTDSISERCAVIVSSAIGGLTALQDGIETLSAKGPARISPFIIPMFISNGASGMLAIDYGVKGPSLSVVSACASGADAIGMAWQLIRSGVVDLVIAGGSDATITEIGFAAFDKVRATSRRNEKPFRTPRPFDLERDGLVMGEGAAVLILESERFARERGAEILAELAGYSSTADAFHMTAPDAEGSGGALAMRLAMASASVGQDMIDYINAHGTGTILNDQTETRAIKRVFGALAYKIPVSSTKSMTGHMMGATGALEAIICTQIIQNNIVPPTINYQTPDPECDLDYVPNVFRETKVDIALSNAFGFGGHNSVLVLRSYN